MGLRLDNCVHCACQTDIVLKPSQTDTPSDSSRAIHLLERGELGRWNCEDDDEDGTHSRCVQLLDDDDKVLWDSPRGLSLQATGSENPRI